MKILVINGPNLNMLGLRDKNNYGNLTLKEINKKLRELAKNKAKLKFYQSNCEGKLVSFIQKHLNYDALIINAGAYTHTSLAIHDALELFKGKIMEVHLSNIKEREEFRHFSYISLLATNSYIGLKEESYYEALRDLLKD